MEKTAHILASISSCSAYWDDHFCPVKPDKNGGDVLHRCGLQAIEWWMNTASGSEMRRTAWQIFNLQLHLHHKGDGNFCRYWQDGWWSGSDVMSRDQAIPIVAALGLYRKEFSQAKSWLNIFETGMRKRKWFFTNTLINNKPGTNKTPDIAGPAFRALLARAQGDMKSRWIPIGDAEELAGSHAIAFITSPPKIKIPVVKNWSVKWEWRYPMGGPRLHEDPVNKTIVLLFNKLTRSETRNATLARQIYAKKGRVWDSWLNYWIRPGDPQCPFHIAFYKPIQTLGRG